MLPSACVSSGSDRSDRKRFRMLRRCSAAAVLLLLPGLCASAQNAGDASAAAAPEASSLPNAPDAQGDGPTLAGTPKRVVQDFAHLLLFPGHVRRADAKWLLPLTAATVTSFALDEHTMREVVTQNPSTNATGANVSDGLRDGLIAAPVLLYGAGLMRGNEHMRETGLLGGEAMVDAYAAGALIKLATFRERPSVDRYEGSFYRTSAGYNSSFVSGHALTAWSSAAVLASEYPNRWMQVGVYTAATGVSLTRVLAQQHFPSDVLLGSAAGWLIGRYVYRHHAHAEGLARVARSTEALQKY